MDVDPELDLTLSNGRHVATFQVAAVDRDLGTWVVVEPPWPRRLLLSDAEALRARQRLDARIADRLATGWVPMTGRRGRATDWPGPVARDLGYLLATLTEHVDTLRAVDPTGQLWAACAILRREAHRHGLRAPLTRRDRARRQRRLGELAERVGDRAAAVRYYRAALALDPGVGVRRRLVQLVAGARLPRRQRRLPSAGRRTNR